MYKITITVIAILIFIAAFATNIPHPIDTTTLESATPEIPTIQESNSTIITKNAPNIETTEPPVSAETPYPKPTYIPTLRSYDVDKNHDIWYAKDPGSYVTPDNEWVKYYANQLYIDNDSRIRYINKSIPWLVDSNGSVLLWTDEPFLNNYTFDIYKETYGYVDKDNVPWLMPDFYLTHGNIGVCSAWANTVTSLMLSGKMSIEYNGTFIRQIIPAKVVLGYTKSGLRDAWVEYQVHNETYVTTTALMKYGLYNENLQSVTTYDLKKDMMITPDFEYTNNYFRKV
jgi:hypothetical protein